MFSYSEAGNQAGRRPVLEFGPQITKSAPGNTSRTLRKLNPDSTPTFKELKLNQSVFIFHRLTEFLSVCPNVLRGNS